MESEARLAMIDGGLLIPELHTRSSTAMAICDELIAWPNHRLAVEYDGLDWHSESGSHAKRVRRPGQATMPAGRSFRSFPTMYVIPWEFCGEWIDQHLRQRSCGELCTKCCWICGSLSIGEVQHL